MLKLDVSPHTHAAQVEFYGSAETSENAIAALA